MANINYAVLALKAAESDALAVKLKTDGLEGMANWLRDNGAELYGETREDWKPFKNETIRQMLATVDRVYESSTGLIDELDENLTNITVLYKASITVYFIDVFALYVDKYRLLANRLDFAVGDGKKAKCCLIVPYGLSKETQEIQDQLMGSFHRLWPTVWQAYLEGNLHRIVSRPDDLINFREYLASAYADQPSPKMMDQMTRRYGQPQREVPRMGI